MSDCVATVVSTLAIIHKWIKGLYPNIDINNRDDLREIEDLFKKGRREILQGGLTEETCLAMALLLQCKEQYARERVLNGGSEKDLNYYEGLKRIHDKMTLLIPPGANEGQKPCEPFC